MNAAVEAAYDKWLEGQETEMTWFERFQVVNRRRHEAEVADLEAKVKKQGLYINDLQAELAPFREHVVALEKQYPELPGPEDAEAVQGPAEAGQAG